MYVYVWTCMYLCVSVCILSVFAQQNLLCELVQTDAYRYRQIHTDTDKMKQTGTEKHIQIHADQYTSKTVLKSLVFFFGQYQPVSGSRFYLFVTVCINCICMFLHSIILYRMYLSVLHVSVCITTYLYVVFWSIQYLLCKYIPNIVDLVNTVSFV